MRLKKHHLLTFLLLDLLLIAFCLGFLAIYLRTDVELLYRHYPVWKSETHDYVLVRKRPDSWVKLNQISPWAKWAIVISEDWAFYEHEGIDLNQLRIVIAESLKKGKLGRGASTITQQVVKNVFLSDERSLIRKFTEMVLAYKLERMVSKNTILEVYLNIVEMGPRIYGIKQAAKYYFQKHPINLTLAESAYIAMLLPSPVRYSESFKKKELTAFARKQIKNILTKMSQAHVITQLQKEMAIGEGIFWDESHQPQIPVEGDDRQWNRYDDWAMEDTE